MERMTPDTDKREWLGEWIYAKFVQNYEKLLEENKNLKLIQETNEKQLKNDIKERDELREENKKLKKERDLYKARNEELNEDCFWLANENKNLKEQIDKLILKIDQLEEENENLRKDLFHKTNDGWR